MPKTWAQYKQDQRARKRAAGCLRLDVTLGGEALVAMGALRRRAPTLSANDIVQHALVMLWEDVR